MIMWPMKPKFQEASTGFDYDQVDRDLGWSEPDTTNTAIDAFHRLIAWVKRVGPKGQPPNACLINRRLSVACWILQPSRQAGVSRKQLAAQLGFSEHALAQDATSFRKEFGVRRRKQRTDTK
jgi:hypothetical protein